MKFSLFVLSIWTWTYLPTAIGRVNDDAPHMNEVDLSVINEQSLEEEIINRWLLDSLFDDIGSISSNPPSGSSKGMSNPPTDGSKGMANPPTDSSKGTNNPAAGSSKGMNSNNESGSKKGMNNSGMVSEPPAPKNPSNAPTPSQETTPSIISPTGPLGNSSGVSMNATNSTFVPVCRRNSLGKFLQQNNNDYNSPTTEISRSTTTTYASTNTGYELATSASETIGSIAGSIADIAEITSKFANAIKAFGVAAQFVSLGLTLLGPLLGGTSPEDAILEAVNDGFRILNNRLNDIQKQISDGFLDLSVLIGDVELDRRAAVLASITRAFNEYVRATNETRPYYDAVLRNACNDPYNTPRDVFYDLYGYACSNCSFAPKKRADLLQVAKDQNKLSFNNFFQRFGNFILSSMFNAMYLHAACLPPIEGSCVDHSVDELWKNGTMEMEAAFNESISMISATAGMLTNWARLISVADIEPFLKEQGDDHGMDNQNSANDIMRFLNATQPDFDVQVLVADTDSNFFRANIWRSGCGKISNPEELLCDTTRDNTGHFWFDISNQKRSVSVRYRLKTLPPASTDVVPGVPFTDFHNGIVDRLNTETSLALRRPDLDDCELDEGEIDSLLFLNAFPACLLDVCVACSAEETSGFDFYLQDNFYIFRQLDDIMFIREATTDATRFPKYEATVGETFLLADKVDKFIFYYI